MNQEDFWLHIDTSGEHWHWRRASAEAYPSLNLEGRRLRAHQAAYLLTYGELPAGHYIVARCGAPGCLRPEHLAALTAKEHAQLLAEQGRAAWARPGAGAHLHTPENTEKRIAALPRGEQHHWQRRPETRPRGERNGMHTRPERRATGDRHGSRTRPERVPRGDQSGTRKHPERMPRGARNHNSKLTWPQAQEIRRRYADELISQKRLAAEYGVSETDIYNIIQGTIWQEQFQDVYEAQAGEEAAPAIAAAPTTPPRPLRERWEQKLWSSIEVVDGCWLWTRGKDESGYGQIRVEGQLHKTHRLAYQLTYGPIPTGQLVLHRCGQPSCINPEHLELGTAPKASRQRHPDGTYQRGDQHWTQRRPDQRPRGEHQSNAKLTWEQVRAMRRRHQAGEPQQALAIEYGVSPATISGIVSGKTWREEPESAP